MPAACLDAHGQVCPDSKLCINGRHVVLLRGRRNPGLKSIRLLGSAHQYFVGGKAYVAVESQWNNGPGILLLRTYRPCYYVELCCRMQCSGGRCNRSACTAMQLRALAHRPAGCMLPLLHTGTRLVTGICCHTAYSVRVPSLHAASLPLRAPQRQARAPPYCPFTACAPNLYSVRPHPAAGSHSVHPTLLHPCTACAITLLHHCMLVQHAPSPCCMRVQRASPTCSRARTACGMRPNTLPG